MGENLIKVRHSYNLGDFIIILPAFKALSERTGKKITFYQRLNLPAFHAAGYEHPTEYNGYTVTMNMQMLEMLKPLLETQSYIQSVEIWEGQKVDYDTDLTRHDNQLPIPYGDIYSWLTLEFPELTCDLSKQWLDVPSGKYGNKVILNRTERYTNPYISYFFLKPYQDQLIFAGTQKERDKFCSAYKLDIPLLCVSDFLELATIINGCKFFMGNQSFCFHVADALKKTRILEMSNQYTNAIPTGANGNFFVKQEGLEYYFNKLINQ